MYVLLLLVARNYGVNFRY